MQSSHLISRWRRGEKKKWHVVGFEFKTTVPLTTPLPGGSCRNSNNSSICTSDNVPLHQALSPTAVREHSSHRERSSRAPLGNSPPVGVRLNHYILQPTIFGRWQGAPLMGKHGVLVWDRIFEVGSCKKHGRAGKD